MTFRTVCKELLRTPFKTVMFLLLLVLSTALLVLGVNLYLGCNAAREEVSANYKTVGTIRQKPDSVRELAEDEVIISTSGEDPTEQYTVTLPDNLFDGLPTLVPVENRPTLITSADFFSQHSPEEALPVKTPPRMLFLYQVITFTPTMDMDTADEEFMKQFAMPEGFYTNEAFSGGIEISAINGEPVGESMEKTLLAEIVWPYPEPEHIVLRAGTEYIAAGYRWWKGNGTLQYCVGRIQKAVTMEKGGMELESAGQIAWENTEEFAQSRDGQWVRELMESSKRLMEMESNSVITVPTRSLTLLDPFYQGDVTIRKGREITPEEFASGAKVCMLSDDFLYTGPEPECPYLNFINVGDKIRLKWHGAVYGMNPAELSSNIGILDAPQVGASYEEAASEEYEIVGIFHTESTGREYGSSDWSATNLGSYEVIVPSASFDFDSIPLAYGGPLAEGSCSFQLENGTGSDFLMAVNKLEHGDLLQITLNDQGYTAVAKGLDAIALLAGILLFSGGASSLCLLLFFVYLQIARRQREAAIQLSLGAGRRRSAVFLLLSVLLVAVVGIAAGTVLGHVVTDTVSTRVYTQAKESGYSREYSEQFEASADKVFDYDGSARWPRTLAAALSALSAAVLLSGEFTASALRKEPLEQLTRRE